MKKTDKAQKHHKKAEASHKEHSAPKIEKLETAQAAPTHHKPSELDPVGTQAATEPFLTEDGVVDPAADLAQEKDNLA